MTEKLKKYETIAACGIDCGLCPRFYTKGNSVCPGCGGPGFKEKHPSCGVLTCCVIKNGFETCADCSEFPCSRFKAMSSGCDSFVTHKKMLSNLEEIKAVGIEKFIEKQNVRIEILKGLLADYDDGRAKSFFCQACALLPTEELQKVYTELRKAGSADGLKERSKAARCLIADAADSLGIDLKISKKQKPWKKEEKT